MARRGNRIGVEWQTNEKDLDWQQVQVEVLMDIREELRRLNRTVGCWRIQRGFDAIARLDKRVAKKISLKRSA